MARILVCGDRNYTDIASIEVLISHLPKDTVIIHGACDGADIFAGQLASKYALQQISFRVSKEDWVKYGRAAGPIRNKQMLDMGKATHVVAFHDNINESKGTKNMLNQAVKAGIYCELWNSKGERKRYG